MSFIKTKVSRPYAWVTLADLATLFQRIRLLFKTFKNYWLSYFFFYERTWSYSTFFEIRMYQLPF